MWKMSSLEFKLLLPLLSNLLLSTYIFVILVIIRIGFISCLVSLSSSSSGDWYISTLAFVKGWNVIAPAFSLIGKDAAVVGKVVKRGVIVEVIRSKVARMVIVNCWFC
jgi:hypothetical protein